jgi:hypothetical protein
LLLRTISQESEQFTDNGKLFERIGRKAKGPSPLGMAASFQRKCSFFKNSGGKSCIKKFLPV